MKYLISGNIKLIKYIFINNNFYSKNEKNSNILLTKYVFFLFYFLNKNLYKKNNIYSRYYMEAILKRFFFLLASFD